MFPVIFTFVVALAIMGASAAENTSPITVMGEIIDADSGKPLAGRIYIQNAAGAWFFPQSAAKEGSALPFKRQAAPKSLEMHTTLSAHPFKVELTRGVYTFRVER